MTRCMTLAEAIDRFVPDGSVVAMGTCLEAAIPFAAGHELIRQGRRDLTLVGPISDMLFDHLVGAGCVRQISAAWVGNVSAGLAHCLRRAVEEGVPAPVEIRDHSNFTIGLALLAAGIGAPFIPTRTSMGSDLPLENPDLIESTNPLNELGEPIVLVRAIQPDVLIVHVQRADEAGHAHLWGPLGVTREAVLAARRIIITAEEVVPSATILRDPNRVIAPAHKVAAVVEVPGGAHPSPVPGYYDRDHAFFEEYHARSRTLEGFEAWLREWVLDLPDHAAYLEHLGAARWQALQQTRETV
nr:CoA-transferase [Ardenticatena sp.]